MIIQGGDFSTKAIKILQIRIYSNPGIHSILSILRCKFYKMTTQETISTGNEYSQWLRLNEHFRKQWNPNFPGCFMDYIDGLVNLLGSVRGHQ